MAERVKRSTFCQWLRVRATHSALCGCALAQLVPESKRRVFASDEGFAVAGFIRATARVHPRRGSWSSARYLDCDGFDLRVEAGAITSGTETSDGEGVGRKEDRRRPSGPEERKQPVGMRVLLGFWS